MSGLRWRPERRLMVKTLIIGLMAVALSGCSKPEWFQTNSKEQKSNEIEAKVAWRQCVFELDKIEAIRGRNLDDLNKGLSVARNQFLMDCLASKTNELLHEQVMNMTKYASPAQSRSRSPDDISLNAGPPRL